MTKPVVMNVEWWINKMSTELMPIERDELDKYWRKGLNTNDYYAYQWYLKEPFLIGLTRNGNNRSLFAAIHLVDPPVTTKWDFSVLNIENTLLFYEALKKPQLLPLCMNISWAKPIVASYLRHLP